MPEGRGGDLRSNTVHMIAFTASTGRKKVSTTTKTVTDTIPRLVRNRSTNISADRHIAAVEEIGYFSLREKVATTGRLL
jgi:hypothetical protein